MFALFCHKPFWCNGMEIIVAPPLYVFFLNCAFLCFNFTKVFLNLMKVESNVYNIDDFCCNSYEVQ